MNIVADFAGHKGDIRSFYYRCDSLEKPIHIQGTSLAAKAARVAK